MGYKEDREANLPLKTSNKQSGRASRKPQRMFKVLRFQQDQPANFQAAPRRNEKNRRNVVPLVFVFLISLCLLLVLFFGIGNWVSLNRVGNTLAEILRRLEIASGQGSLSVDPNVTYEDPPTALAVIKKIKLSPNSTGFLAVPFNVTANYSMATNKSVVSLDEGHRKAPLTLLVELVQRGARFTCDTVCEVPAVIKSHLRVNGESHSWEGLGENTEAAKQEASFKALKELYAPHILAEVYYEPRNFTFECIQYPAANNATNNITSSVARSAAKKC